MKVFFAFAVALLAGLPTSWGCSEGIVATYHYKRIAESPDYDDATRAWARESYEFMEQMHRRRDAAGAASAGEGIDSSDDDQDFPEEQDPDDAGALIAEEASLLLTDEETAESGLAPPAGEPDPAGSPPEGTSPQPPPSHRRRRWALPESPKFASLYTRQSTVAPRYIYTDQNRCNPDARGLVLTENSGTTAADTEINWVYYNVGRARLMFANVFKRTSLDGLGLRYHATGRLCNRLGNAFWNGNQMLFGDGDGVLFKYGSLVRALDVSGHELTHGLVQYLNPLKYLGQSGALNEHLADVFGALADQWWSYSTASNASWLIGNGLPVGGGALRSLKAPGTAYNNPRGLGRDPQPANMADYNNSPDDNYGVHINSGIPNHAFYLASVAIGGQPIQIPGRIWYSVLTGEQGRFSYRDETFATFAQRTINAAEALFNATIADAVHTAWRQVGVLS